MKLPIYMDHNATTPVDPRVLDVMLPYLRESFGNAASRNHSFGRTAEKAVGQARGQCAAAIDASAKEITFTLDLDRTGETTLEAWFIDDSGEEQGAYYVYVERL